MIDKIAIGFVIIFCVTVITAVFLVAASLENAAMRCVDAGGTFVKTHNAHTCISVIDGKLQAIPY